MNAPAKMPGGKPLEDVIWLLETRALIRAFLEFERQYEHLADAIDPLQEFAEQSGLVAAIGQDEVQRVIAGPFERFRAIVAAEIAAEQAPDLPSDYAAQLVKQWELDDPRDRWRWTGEQPPTAEIRNGPIGGVKANKPAYRSPQSTIDAFNFVAGLGDPDRLRAWLRDHPDIIATVKREVA